MSERGPVAFHGASILRNVAAGARLGFFLPVRAHHFRAAALDFALISLLSFVLWVVAAGARHGFEGEFDPLSIPAYMSGLLLVLAAALLVALVYGERERLLLVAVALTASQPGFHLAALIILGIGYPAWLERYVLYAFIAWVWVISLRAVVVCAGIGRPQILWGALIVTAMVAIDLRVLPEVAPWRQADE